jgi:hypothetical protein
MAVCIINQIYSIFFQGINITLLIFYNIKLAFTKAAISNLKKSMFNRHLTQKRIEILRNNIFPKRRYLKLLGAKN